MGIQIIEEWIEIPEKELKIKVKVSGSGGYRKYKVEFEYNKNKFEIENFYLCDLLHDFGHFLLALTNKEHHLMSE